MNSKLDQINQIFKQITTINNLLKIKYSFKYSNFLYKTKQPQNIIIKEKY